MVGKFCLFFSFSIHNKLPSHQPSTCPGRDLDLVKFCYSIKNFSDMKSKRVYCKNFGKCGKIQGRKYHLIFTFFEEIHYVVFEKMYFLGLREN